MPKPMLNRPQTQTNSDNILSATYAPPKKQAKTIDKVALDRMLRQPRSKRYMDAMTKLDAGGHTHNENQVREIIDAIKAEFPEVEITGVLLGFVSKCYLGTPYEVHTLDMTGITRQVRLSPEDLKKPELLPSVATTALLRFMLTAAAVSVQTALFPLFPVKYKKTVTPDRFFFSIAMQQIVDNDFLKKILNLFLKYAFIKRGTPRNQSYQEG